MYYNISTGLVGYCEALDYTSSNETGYTVSVSEDLRDAIPYLYEKHFGVPYRELGWWLEPGAKEFVKDLEDKWMHNKLDLSEVYKDEEFLKLLSEKYASYSTEALEQIKEDFEDELRWKLDLLSLKELKLLQEEYGDTIDYDIYDSDDNVVDYGYVDLPDDYDEEDEEDEDDI